MINKGTIRTDHSYSYVCGNCRDAMSEECPHCYGGNPTLLLEAFSTARGERYYALLKAILRIQGKAIYDLASELRETRGSFTPVDIAALMLAFGWPSNRMKPMAEWLEETRFIPAGTYDDLHESGLRVRDMLEAARKREEPGA